MPDQTNSGMFKDYTAFSKSMNTPSSPPMGQPGMQFTPQTPSTGTPPVYTPSAPPFAPPSGDMMPPTTVVNPYYLAGYLRTQIGKTMRVEFSLGTTGALTDRTGMLEEVGAAYIVLRLYPTNNKFVGDLYSIKFVTIFQ